MISRKNSGIAGNQGKQAGSVEISIDYHAVTLSDC